MSHRHPLRTLLAIVGGCVALAIVVPPLAGVLDAAASLGLLGLAGVAVVRAVIWVDRLGRAARRVGTVRRTPPAPSAGRARTPEAKPVREPAPEAKPARRTSRGRDGAGPAERPARWPAVAAGLPGPDRGGGPPR